MAHSFDNSWSHDLRSSPVAPPPAPVFSLPSSLSSIQAHAAHAFITAEAAEKHKKSNTIYDNGNNSSKGSTISSVPSLRLSRTFIPFHVTSYLSRPPPVATASLRLINESHTAVKYEWHAQQAAATAEFSVAPLFGTVPPFGSCLLTVSFSPSAPCFQLERLTLDTKPAIKEHVKLQLFGACCLADEGALQRLSLASSIQGDFVSSVAAPSLPALSRLSSVDLRRAFYAANREYKYPVYFNESSHADWLALFEFAQRHQAPESRLRLDWSLSLASLEALIEQMPSRYFKQQTQARQIFWQLVMTNTTEPQSSHRRVALARGLLIDAVREFSRPSEQRENAIKQAINKAVQSFAEMAGEEGVLAEPPASHALDSALSLFSERAALTGRCHDEGHRVLVWGCQGQYCILPGPMKTEAAKQNQGMGSFRPFTDPSASRAAAEEETARRAAYRAHPLESLSELAVIALSASSQQCLVATAGGLVCLIAANPQHSQVSALSNDGAQSGSSSAKGGKGAQSAKSKAAGAIKSPRSVEPPVPAVVNDSVPALTITPVSALCGLSFRCLSLAERFALAVNDQGRVLLVNLEQINEEPIDLNSKYTQLHNERKAAKLRVQSPGHSLTSPARAAPAASKKAQQPVSAPVDAYAFAAPEEDQQPYTWRIEAGGRSRLNGESSSGQPALDFAFLTRSDGCVYSFAPALAAPAVDAAVAKALAGVVGVEAPSGKHQTHSEDSDWPFQLVPSLHPQSLARLLSQPARVVHVACGFAHSLALTDNGQLFTWGSNNEYAQLGSADKKARPLPVHLNPLWPAGGEFPGAATAIACGAYHNILQVQDGRVFAYGRGLEGQLGNGESVNKAEPVRVLLSPDVSVVSFSCGQSHSLFQAAGGVCWSSGRSSFKGPEGATESMNVNAPIIVNFRPMGGTRDTVKGAEQFAFTAACGDWNWGIHKRAREDSDRENEENRER